MICNKCNHNLPDDSEFCQYCGEKIKTGFRLSVYTDKNTQGSKTQGINSTDNSCVNTTVETEVANVVCKNLTNNKLILFTNFSSVVITFISMVFIIFAMNIQDYKRDFYENWEPTAVYCVLLVLLGAFMVFAIISLIKIRFKLIFCLSIIPVIATMITVFEGSIFSYSYVSEYSGYNVYKNFDEVQMFNIIWIVCVALVMLVTLVTFIILSIWHKSLSYREKCYKRVEKIHGYLEKGIITEAEYEKTRSDILKNIE